MAVEIIHHRGAPMSYLVRVRGGGPGKSKSVAIRKHGSAERAKAVAERIEAQLDAAHPRIDRTGLKLSTNTSNVVGISCRWEKMKSGDFNLSVQASWQVDGEPKSTRYSVNRYGMKKAIRMAYNRRKKSGVKMPPFSRVLADLKVPDRPE